MSKMKKKHDSRLRRQKRVRKSVTGTNVKPRLCVYRSLQYTYAQLISDESGLVIGSATTRTLDVGDKGRGSVESAKVLGEQIAKIAKEKSITHVVFDRNGYVYHGRLSAVAEGAREGGLAF